MPFVFPNLWSPASVYAPKTDLNPVPGGQTNNYWASVESNFVSSSLVSVSSSLSGTELAINVLSASTMLNNEPVYGWSYTASYSSSLLTQELWNDTASGFRIKQNSYGYLGTLLTASVAAVFDPANGTTVLAAATSSYFYSGSILTSATLVRSV
ncbi:MAG: hypothetical protein A2139_12630 [Desulfobacca sp. RBG_16_60_12]|nr:MAG: hypothetical protein A2139_12630 [Desulfobacca sp. RBG_16_60_12]